MKVQIAPPALHATVLELRLQLPSLRCVCGHLEASNQKWLFKTAVFPDAPLATITLPPLDAKSSTQAEQSYDLAFQLFSQTAIDLTHSSPTHSSATWLVVLGLASICKLATPSNCTAASAMIGFKSAL